MGFEPTPTFVDQNAPCIMEEIALESGALDRSAILTIDIMRMFKVLIAFFSAAQKTFYFGEPGHRSRYLSHAKRALYHLS